MEVRIDPEAVQAFAASLPLAEVLSLQDPARYPVRFDSMEAEVSTLIRPLQDSGVLKITISSIRICGTGRLCGMDAFIRQSQHLPETRKVGILGADTRIRKHSVFHFLSCLRVSSSK